MKNTKNAKMNQSQEAVATFVDEIYSEYFKGLGQVQLVIGNCVNMGNKAEHISCIYRSVLLSAVQEKRTYFIKEVGTDWILFYILEKLNS